MTSSTDESGAGPERGTYYKFDNRRLTYAEIWRFSRGPFGFLNFLIVAAMKLLRIRIKPAAGVFYPAKLICVSPDELLDWASEALHPAVGEWEAQRLLLVSYYTIDFLGEAESCGGVFLSEDEAIVAMTAHTRLGPGGIIKKRTVSSAISRMPDGVLLVTTTERHDLEESPLARVHYLTGRTIAEVAAHHRHRLANIALVPAPVAESTAVELLAELENHALEFQIERGVYLPMTPEEIEAERIRLGRIDDAFIRRRLSERPESRNPYQSPGFSTTATEPEQAEPGLSPWPLIVLWLGWPAMVSCLSAIFLGEPPSSFLFPLILAASDAWFVDYLMRRRKRVRTPWRHLLLSLLIFALIIAAQMVAVFSSLVLIVYFHKWFGLPLMP